MSRPRLLDLFCCAGGAGMGYHRAGFDAVHASPPCQDHSSLDFGKDGKEQPNGTAWMLRATIERLAASGLPYVVENVVGADMPGAFTLCGRSFGIARLRRHRLFLTNVPVLVPPCGCHRGAKTLGVYGDLSKNDRSFGTNPDGYRRMRAGVATARELLDCPWMDAHELTQAIPPVYTEHVGGYLLAAVGAGVGS